VHVADQVRRVMRSRRILAQKLNRAPTTAEIAADCGFTEERVRDLLELIEEPISLETPVGDGESVYGDLIEDEHTDLPEDVAAERLRSVEVREALMHLNPRLREVLERRFGLAGDAPETLEQVGRELGITRERVRQLESRALRELRLAAPQLHHYIRSE